MKVAKTADWRDDVPFDTPRIVAEVAPGAPTRCAVCGADSEPRNRTELWAVKLRHPHHHDGYVRFYCEQHVPAVRAVEPARVERARSAPRPAARRAPAQSDRVRAMCPNCFIEVSATGVCGVCGTAVA